jgi:RND family efflux transporter MFP subunit
MAMTSRIASIGLIILTFSGCHQEPQNILPVATSSPYAAIANGKVDVEGGVIEIAARRFGMIKEVLVHEGDEVKKGQLLAKQDDQELALAILNARAVLAQAETQLELSNVNTRVAARENDRLKRLSASNSIARQQLDQAADAVATSQAQLSNQQAAIRVARAQLAQAVYGEELTNIRAPVDGKIIRRYANPGSGASTLNVSNMFDLEPALPHIVRAEIVETAIPKVSVGQQVQIVPESDATKVFNGRVIRIAASFGARRLKSDGALESTDERVVEVVVSAEDTPFLIGQRVMVKFLRP